MAWQASEGHPILKLQTPALKKPTAMTLMGSFWSYLLQQLTNDHDVFWLDSQELNTTEDC